MRNAAFKQNLYLKKQDSTEAEWNFAKPYIQMSK